MKTYFSTIKHSLLVFLLSFLAVNIANGQANNFVQLFDYAGDESYLDYKTALETAADSLVAAFPSEFQNQFKVYDFGFYLHQGDYDGPGYPEAFNDIVKGLGSPYYLAFGRQTDGSGVNVKVWVDVKLPEEDCFAAYTTLYRTLIKNQLTTAANIEEKVYLGIVNSINIGKTYVAAIAPCCDPGRESGDCEVPPALSDFASIKNYLETIGFLEFECTSIGIDQNATGQVSEINLNFQFPVSGASPGPHQIFPVPLLSEITGFGTTSGIEASYTVKLFNNLEEIDPNFATWQPEQVVGNYFEDILVFHTESNVYHVFSKLETSLLGGGSDLRSEDDSRAAVAPAIWLLKRVAMAGVDVLFEAGIELAIESWISGCSFPEAWEQIDFDYGNLTITFFQGLVGGGTMVDALFEVVRGAYEHLMSLGPNSRSADNWTVLGEALAHGVKNAVADALAGKFMAKASKRVGKISQAIKDEVNKLDLLDQINFVFDLKSGPEKLRDFVSSVWSVKAWKFAAGCPSSVRLDDIIFNGLTDAIQRGVKDIPDVVAHANHPAITNRTIEHIFRGDTGGGRHHISAILYDENRKLVDRLVETSDGFYGAVFISGGRKSFWPDTWDEFRIMDELKFVLNNSPNNIAGNRWQAKTQGGQLIEYYLHADGYIISAFPVLPNFP